MSVTIHHALQTTSAVLFPQYSESQLKKIEVKYMSGDWIISPDCTSYRNAQHPDSTFYCIIYNFIECFISYIVLLYNMIWSQIIEYCMSHIIFYVMINIWSYDTVWNYTYNNYYCIIWYDSMHHRNQYNISISISSLFSYHKIKEAS